MPGDEVSIHEEDLVAGEDRQTSAFFVEALLSTTASGQARVYLVRDASGSKSALKVYHADRDPKVRPSEELLHRYSELRHRHLVTVRAHGYGADGIEGTFDWELLEVLEPLRLPLDQGPRERWVETTLAPALGGAIEALLSASLVHCDIKPANLMQRPSTGEIVLVDIGSVKGVNASTRESVTTLVATTSAYAAPELLRKHVNEKTDAFSAGMTLFEFARPGVLSSPNDKDVVARISRGQPVLDRLETAPRLCDLVNGLTRGDLTSRWGEEQFREWLSGKQVAEPAAEVSLPVIKWRKQQISTVPALLQVMADEAAFWSMCEDEGELPHTLRQWVHLLHDETVGAALSRLIKRCLADGEPGLGVTAIRRVLVPEGPFSVKGRQFEGTTAGAVEAIRAAGSVPADVEVALRLWAYHDAESSAAAVLTALPAAATTRARVKRSGLELRLGFQELPSGWEGAKFWHRLRIALHGPVGADELERRAREVVLAVPVGTAEGPWRGELEVAAALTPDAAAEPTTWRLWEASRGVLPGVAFGGSFIPERKVIAQNPARLQALWAWPPGRVWLQDCFSICKGAFEPDEAVEALLWESGRKWLVMESLVLQDPQKLCDLEVETSVMRWLEGAAGRRARLLRWVDSREGAGSAPVGRRGSKSKAKTDGGGRSRSVRSTMVHAFRALLGGASEAVRDAAAREVVEQVRLGNAEAPWQGSARLVAVLAPEGADKVTNWDLLRFAHEVRAEVCVGERILTQNLLERESAEFLVDLWAWPPGRTLLSRTFPELAVMSRGDEAAEAIMTRAGRHSLVVGSAEVRNFDELSAPKLQTALLLWLRDGLGQANRLLRWAEGQRREISAPKPRADEDVRDTGEDDASEGMVRAHEILWSYGCRGVSLREMTCSDPVELADATREVVEAILQDRVGRAWLSQLGGAWAEPLREPEMELAVHRLWWAAGSTNFQLEGRRLLHRPTELGSIEDCEAVLASQCGREWLTRVGGAWAVPLAEESQDLAIHKLWWEAGGTSIRLPSSRRVAASPVDADKWSDSERNEVIDCELGRAWMVRHDVVLPAQGPESRPLLLWALGHRDLSISFEGKPVVFAPTDFELATIATVHRIWKCWSPLTFSWLQRLVGDVEWNSSELPNEVDLGLDGVRHLTAIANRVGIEGQLCLAVRPSGIDWEMHERCRFTDAPLGATAAYWAGHHRRPSFSALVELEILHPGIIRSMVVPIINAADSARDVVDVLARLSDHCTSPMNLIRNFRDRLDELCYLRIERGSESYERAIVVAGDLENGVQDLAVLRWNQIEVRMLTELDQRSASSSYFSSASIRGSLSFGCFCALAWVYLYFGWSIEGVSTEVSQFLVWALGWSAVLIFGFVGFRLRDLRSKKLEAEFRLRYIRRSLVQAVQSFEYLARIAKMHAPVPPGMARASRGHSGQVE